MAYQEITSNKTITLKAEGGTYCTADSLYYCGNKSTNTGTIMGNAGKQLIKAYVDPAITWITNVEVSEENDGNKNDIRMIDISYTKNDSGSERSVNLKLNGMQSSAYYLILKQPKYTESTPSKVKVNVVKTISITDFTSGASLNDTGEVLLGVYKTSARSEYGDNIVDYYNVKNTESHYFMLDYNTQYDYIKFTIDDIELSKVTQTNHYMINVTQILVQIGLSSTSKTNVSNVASNTVLNYHSDTDAATVSITNGTRTLAMDGINLKFTSDSTIYIDIQLSIE